MTEPTHNPTAATTDDNRVCEVGMVERVDQRFYDDAESRDELVWRICEYTHGGVFDCERCPANYDEPGHGSCKRGCRALAEEAIAIVLSAALAPEGVE